jgi:hypothetical protein
MGILKEIFKSKEVQQYTLGQHHKLKMIEARSYKKKSNSSSSQMVVEAEATAETWINQVSNPRNTKASLHSIKSFKRQVDVVSETT